ncbi:hypothetical protein [Bacillus sp. SM2101]|uniref:hypothetical protein n=1 Tax=Bacillus sp. SM2101 TaxID=2805366 RepID=UPI001BDF1DA5|nr:hypothetical protein [Bacillus sp. SM2101]
MVNCKCKGDKCPEYFENQLNDTIPIGVPQELIKLPVLIKNNDMKVKIDSSIEVFTEAFGLSASVFYSFNYLLQRSTNNGNFKTLAFIQPAQNLEFPDPIPNGPFLTGSLIPNLTWTDKNAGIGSHVYRIFMDQPFRVNSVNANTTIRTRSINATLFCH